MAEVPGPPAGPPSAVRDRGTRLDSWKEIAAYVKRDVRTLQRWEKTAGLPVRRLQKPGLRAVYAYTADLDDWLRDQGPGGGDESVAAAASPAPTASTDAPAPTRWARRGLLYATFATVVLVVVAAAAVALRPPAPVRLGPFSVRPITSEPGNEREPDVSPDGKYVAYAQQAPDLRSRIVVRLVDGGEPHDLTAGTQDEWSPAWSPDGARIAFLRGDPAGTATLVVTSALGGDERVLATVHPYARRRVLLIGHLVAWTPDGRHLIVPDQLTAGEGSLVRIATDTGKVATLTNPGDAHFDVEPSISPDGRLLLFNRVRSEYQSDIFVQPLDAAYLPSGPPSKLPAAGAWNGTPRLLEDRREVLWSAGALPRLSLWHQPVDGSGTPTPLGIFGNNATESALDPVHGRIVVRTFRSQADVLRFALPAASAEEAIEPPVQELLESTYIDRGPVYSPDGSRIAFISDRSGARQLWVADADGGNPVEWSQRFEADLPRPAWSPDGSRIAFAGIGPAGNTQLFVADRASRLAVRVTDDALDYVGPAWSPDGRHLYAAAAERSQYSIYRVPVGGGPADKVLPDRVDVIGVVPGGQGLYVVRRVRRVEVDLEYFPLPAGPAVHIANMNFRDDAWMTPRGVYYMERTGDEPLAPVALTFRSHEGAVTVLQKYARAPGRGLSLSPDGRYAVTTRFVPPIADLLLLEPTR